MVMPIKENLKLSVKVLSSLSKNALTHTHLIVGPVFGIRKQPGGGASCTLLGANLQRADHRDAVIVTCR